jgi:multidrug efflux pump subunit AcrB
MSSSPEPIMESVNPTQTSWLRRTLARPHIVLSLLALFIVMGLMGYQKMPRNLFPDSNYPEVAVVIIQPGASAKSMAANIAVPVEEELYTLDGIRRAYSDTIDEVTVIHAEFEYTKDIDAALSDVSGAVAKLRSKLPADIKEPQAIKITIATAPIEVIAMSPREGSGLSLEDIRDIASGEIKHALLKTPGVANVDIFGGYAKEVQIVIDKNRLDALHLSLGKVIAAIKKNDNDYAVGTVESTEHRYLLKSQGKRNTIEQLKALPLTKDVRLCDVAKVYFGHYKNTATYYGNNRKAIALSIQRATTADVIDTIHRADAVIEEFKTKYPAIEFSLSDTQEETIALSTDNMFESLRDAIVMSTIVVFLFLASFRQILVVLVTIPLVYASTIAMMWLVGLDFNVITLTSIILALGLLLDNSVVVMENIERHYAELGKPIRQAVYDGTEEIMFSVMSGTVTTMIALVPMLFVGGYPQTVFAPLVGTLLIALGTSYVISIITVPLLSLKVLAAQNPLLLDSEAFFHRIIGAVNNATQAFFSGIVRAILDSKVVALVAFGTLIALFVVAVKLVMPVVGMELTPPMDTGAVNIKITVEPNLPLSQSEAIMQRLNAILKEQGELVRTSGSIGSEAGVMSIGSGSGIDHLKVVATYVDRHHREEDIWQIAAKIREAIATLPHIKYFDVTPYGAIAMASIKGNVDAQLSSSDLSLLQAEGEKVKKALGQTKGIVTVLSTWDMDKTVYDLQIDEATAAAYGLSRADIAQQLQMVLRGAPVANFPRTNAQDYNVRVWLPQAQIDQMAKIETMLIDTPKGKIPLTKFATIVPRQEPSLITRNGLSYTLDIYGNREKAALSHIMADFEKHLDEVNLSKEVTLKQIGDTKSFNSATGRMLGAIATAIALIFLSLVVMFGDVKVSLMILLSIPLTIVGASWAMLLMNYHVSMAAMMGFILLSGVIVNNSILLIHFALEKIGEGASKRKAMLESIQIRTRPVLMTAFSVSVAMYPVALGAAIGLEKLAPLGAVTIGGLLVGTFMTLVFVPIVFIWTIDEEKIRRVYG